MKINAEDFRAREGHTVHLRKWPTDMEPVYKSKEQYHNLLAEHVAQLSSLQQLLYASNCYAIWYVVPADDKENARLIVSQIVRLSFHAPQC